MHYVSTRGKAPRLDFANVTLAGLANDGGLYVPEQWPSVDVKDIAALSGRAYADVAATIMQPFIGKAIAPEVVRDLAHKAYAGFHHGAVTPLTQLDERHWLLELFHGPTLAFKDVALQFLGLLFEHLLEERDEALTIVGATSGDTGSAAIHAVAGRENIDIFMLHPKDRVSDVQRRQMTTVLAPNVYNIAVEGSFDDCQAMVKQLLGDEALRRTLKLSAVNSINWARVMAQVVYYFTSAVSLGAPHRKVAFSVPTGNFGDVFAGYVAAQMGLGVERLIVATNVNDILYRALTNGDYSSGTVTPTITPSMDIQISSNFERLMFDLMGRDAAALSAHMTHFGEKREMRLDDAFRSQAAHLFTAHRVDHEATNAAMAWAYECSGEIIDPHTAVGLHAARQLEGEIEGPIVTLATAHPGKFRDVVERATGVRPSLPHHVGDLFSREERFDVLPNDINAVRAYIEKRAAL